MRRGTRGEDRYAEWKSRAGYLRAYRNDRSMPAGDTDVFLTFNEQQV